MSLVGVVKPYVLQRGLDVLEVRLKEETNDDVYFTASSTFLRQLPPPARRLFASTGHALVIPITGWAGFCRRASYVYITEPIF
jgi:hypothetical protein